MRFAQTVIVLAKDAYGPFKDAVGTDREGRTYPYLTVVGAEVGEPMKVNVAQGVDPALFPIMTPTKLDLELYGSDKLKLRTHGLSTADTPIA